MNEPQATPNDSQQHITIITSVAEAGTLETMPIAQGMELIRTEELLTSDRRFEEHEYVCITSEYSLAAVLTRLDPARQRAVGNLKDKYRFRVILDELYPGYGFRLVKPGDIDTLSVDRKSVIKPRRGIFGTAVRVIDKDTDLGSLSRELMNEIGMNARVYPDSVLSSDEFIVEDHIDGEEYAIDMFYDSEGKPCILNIAHHPIPANKGYLHMMYNSSKAAFDLLYPQVKQFFIRLNEVLQVKRFAMHAEVRVSQGRIIPLEINAMRFGGMGFCNLVYYSLGINPFLYFLHDREPDWDLHWEGHGDKVYSFFIAYNGKSVVPDQMRPLPGKLTGHFTRVIREQLFDHRKQLAFGIYFLEETESNIRKLLEIDFDDFFEPVAG